jgi:hypothetical protein
VGAASFRPARQSSSSSSTTTARSNETSSPTSALWTSSPAGTTSCSSALPAQQVPSRHGLSVRACQAGYQVLFATAAEWVDRLAAARCQGVSLRPVLTASSPSVRVSPADKDRQRDGRGVISTGPVPGRLLEHPMAAAAQVSGARVRTISRSQRAAENHEGP